MTIDTVNIVKVNDQELNGLVFKRDDAAAAPTIYVDHLYEQYKEGEDIRAIAGELTQCYLDSLIESPEVIQPDMSYENIKDNLTLRLVELKRNRMYLVNVPYMTVGNGRRSASVVRRPCRIRDSSSAYRPRASTSTSGARCFRQTPGAMPKAGRPPPV